MREFLFKVAKSDISGDFVGFAFENLSSIMPVDRIVNTHKTIVFRHPVAQWQVHFLAVPKKGFKSLSSLNLEKSDNVDQIRDLLKSIQQAADKENVDKYAILLNGGKYQDVPQLHFHIISGISKEGIEPLYLQYYKGTDSKTISENTNIVTKDESGHFREFHVAISSPKILGNIQMLDLSESNTLLTVSDMLTEAQKVVDRQKLTQYTLLSVCQPENTGLPFTIHLVSGKSTN